ncbi:hypothetical protein CP532_3766 [Ophiocordyceps camponoti-leonardi (nom. inval.)]|nr:hypothetical protein CP532_3766 [Ophiocordyceps camponoti-leonardi (nom. inval.)]
MTAVSASSESFFARSRAGKAPPPPIHTLPKIRAFLKRTIPLSHGYWPMGITAAAAARRSQRILLHGYRRWQPIAVTWLQRR